VIQNTQGPRGNWPSGETQSPGVLNTDVINGTFENPYEGVPPVIASTPFPGSGWSFDPALQDPLSFQWNLELERQLGQHMVATAAYVGSESGRLNFDVPQNIPMTLGPSAVADRVPFPQMTPNNPVIESVGRSSFQSLQLMLNKRFSAGGTFLSSYTWSHLIDIGCAQVWEGCSIQNPYNLNAEMGNSALDMPQVLTLSYVQESPFGSGHRFLSNGGVAAHLLGGWEVSGITDLRSGIPYTVNLSFDNANNSGTSERPNLVGNPILGNPTVSEWFNTAAFAVPPPYTYRDLGRNTMFGDGYVDFDFALMRNFKITARPWPNMAFSIAP
jgi:hypothetical protein